MSRKPWITIVTLALLAVSLPLLAPPALAEDAIRLGVAGPQSGNLAPFGIPAARAAELVVKEVNARGGVLGRRVELTVADDQCAPEIATNAATKLVSEGVVAVMGHVCSGATKTALPIYLEARILAISPSATNPELTQSGDYPNFYRTIASDDMQAKLDVDFAINTLKVKKIAVLHDKGDYGKGLAEYAKGFVEKSGGKAEVVLFEGVTTGAVDYSAVVQKVKESGAEAVIFGGYHPEASKIVSGMRKKGMNTFFVSDDGVKGDAFIKLAGADAEGVYASGPKDMSKNPLNAAAAEAHRKAFNSEPGQFYPEGWAATQALLNAISKAGSTDYDKVAQALRTEYVDTPLGRIRFDARGDAEGVGFSMYQVQKGVYVELK